MGDHRSRATPPRPPRHRWRPWLAVLVGALALALGVAACSGGDKPSGVASLGGAGSATGTTSAGGSQDEQQAALNWARCMRQHGIDLPDPQFNGNNIAYPRPDRAVRNSAKYKAAEQACKQHQPGGGQAQRPNPEKLQRALAFARCMRQHGINIPRPAGPRRRDRAGLRRQRRARPQGQGGRARLRARPDGWQVRTPKTPTWWLLTLGKCRAGCTGGGGRRPTRRQEGRR
jgi:hypothetical protein